MCRGVFGAEGRTQRHAYDIQVSLPRHVEGVHHDKGRTRAAKYAERVNIGGGRHPGTDQKGIARSSRVIWSRVSRAISQYTESCGGAPNMAALPLAVQAVRVGERRGGRPVSPTRGLSVP